MVARVIDRLNMTLDTTGKYIWIPEESPNWFAPPLGAENKPFIKESPGKKEFLYFDKESGICYYAILNW